MPEYEAVLPAEKTAGKGKGAKGPGAVPLYKFPGPSKEEKLSQLYGMWFKCTRCFLGELKHNLYPGDDDIVFGVGNPDATVLIVGEAPGAEEEEVKYPFIGPSGRTLNQMLAKTSDNQRIRELFYWFSRETHSDQNQTEFHKEVNEWRHSEFYVTNVVGCQPPENRAPTHPEVKACWERLWNIIYIVDPAIIVAVGNTALAVLTKKLSAQITTVRGSVFDVTFDGMVGSVTYPVIPVLHPSFLNRTADWARKDGYYAKTLEDIRNTMRVADFIRNKNYGTPIPERG